MYIPYTVLKCSTLYVTPNNLVMIRPIRVSEVVVTMPLWLVFYTIGFI